MAAAKTMTKEVDEKKKEEEITKRIVRRLNRRDRKGFTLLHYVAKSDDIDLARVIIKSGSQVNVPRRDNGTLYDPPQPLVVAIVYNKLEMVKLLLENGAKHDKDLFYDKRVPLHLAVQYGNLEIAQLLHAYNVFNINVRDQQGRTPLHYACTCIEENKCRNHVEIIKFLMASGASIDPVDKEGFTPLYHAVRCDFHQGIKLMCSNSIGAHICTDENTNFHCLHTIVTEKDITTLKMLFDLGALDNIDDIDELDERGYTCLHLAASRAMDEAIELLIERGARVNTINPNDGMDPLSFAIRQWSHHYLESNVAFFSNYQNGIIEFGINHKLYQRQLQCLKFLIEAGANVNAVCQIDGITPLYFVLHEYSVLHSEFARVLLNEGANVDFDHFTVINIFSDQEPRADPDHALNFRRLLLKRAALAVMMLINDGNDHFENIPVKGVVENFQYDRLDEQSFGYYNDCIIELSFAKERMIGKLSSVTFYDVLCGLISFNDQTSTIIHQNPILTDNRKILEIFPIYGDLINRNLSRLSS